VIADKALKLNAQPDASKDKTTSQPQLGGANPIGIQAAVGLDWTARQACRARTHLKGYRIRLVASAATWHRLRLEAVRGWHQLLPERRFHFLLS
jgi:hypothetical protein